MKAVPVFQTDGEKEKKSPPATQTPKQQKYQQKGGKEGCLGTLIVYFGGVLK